MIPTNKAFIVCDIQRDELSTLNIATNIKH
jgi:hypothetical protein